MKPRDMGVLFDECAARGSRTTVHLDRPFDLAPERGTRWTVPGLAALVRETAGMLAAAGVRPGDRVALVKQNHWDYDLLACAAVRIGAVPAQLSARLSGEALVTLLARLSPALLVTSAQVLARARREEPTRPPRPAPPSSWTPRRTYPAPSAPTTSAATPRPRPSAGARTGH